MKVILGESQFSQSLLSELIKTKESELAELQKEQEAANKALADLAAVIAE
ncbi:MAG: hypothetical protein FWD58_08220 [Firmicutes bacterium]|nr:hypothetical protein [Bacillota bacterium]